MAAITNIITSATLHIIDNLQIVIAQLLNFIGYILIASLQLFGFVGYIFGWIGFVLAWTLGFAVPCALGGGSAYLLFALLASNKVDAKDAGEELSKLATSLTLCFQIAFLVYLHYAHLEPAETYSTTVLMAMSAAGVLVLTACGWMVFFACLQIQKLTKVMCKDGDGKEKVERLEEGGHDAEQTTGDILRVKILGLRVEVSEA